jgi:hypothetical protein
MTEQAQVSEIFKENSVQAVRWNRINRITLNNPLVGDKSAQLDLHAVTKIGSDIISDTLKQQFNVIYNQDTAETKFPLLNPTDDSVIGESSFTEFFVLAYSFAKYSAFLEDQKIAAQAAQMELMQKRMELQAQLQAQREALAEEQRQAQATLEAELQESLNNLT